MFQSSQRNNTFIPAIIPVWYNTLQMPQGEGWPLTFRQILLLALLSSLFLWGAGSTIDQNFKTLEKTTGQLVDSLRIEHHHYLYSLRQKQLLQKEKKHRSKFFISLKEIFLKRQERLYLSNLLMLQKIEIKSKHPKPIERKQHKKRGVKKSFPYTNAPLFAKIRISKQKMFIYQKGKLLYSWKISTGKKGHSTPTGIFKPIQLSKHYRSRKYNNASMPYAVFFRNGYAVHGTKSTWRLGRRASHGCIRLHPSHAKIFYNLVKNTGLRKTKIRIIR